MNPYRETGSFRDRSGFIFYKGDAVYRAIGTDYHGRFTAFMQSGLYQKLVDQKLLVRHEELSEDHWPSLDFSDASITVGKVIKVEKVPFISYPYEWCFQQLKDAALLTLEIQLIALEHDMTLKDASAFNVQFLNGRPVFIDTLSFDQYQEGQPWIAYRQFCKHFLAPLAIISLAHDGLRKVNELFIDGIPLDIASALLPYKTKWSPFFQMHLHYHAKMEARYADNKKAGKIRSIHLSKNKQVAIVQHLISGIKSLSLPVAKSEWADYYREYSYSDASIAHKKELVLQWTTGLAPEKVWDLGCNTGLFSELIQPVSGHITACDIDHRAIENLYTQLKNKSSENILPLVLDLSNPTPAVGWANAERKSFIQRGPADLVLALALIHHLAISNNVPLQQIASFFQSITQWLIIEFVPKADPQAQRLLVTREDIFDDYTQENFESAFSHYFTIEQKATIEGIDRTLYLMKKK